MELEDLKTAINRVRGDLERRYPMRLVGIFGSTVRGQAHERSDVDILAEPGPGLSLFKLGAVQLALEEAVGRPADIVFADVLQPRVRTRILAELQTL